MYSEHYQASEMEHFTKIVQFLVGNYFRKKPILHAWQASQYASVSQTLREKCPDTELFLVRIQENTDQK